MASLSRLPPADAKVYHDYLLPSLSLLPNDPEESVRVAYALAVAHLAAAAHEHLLGMQFDLATAGPAHSDQQQQPAVAPTYGGDVGSGSIRSRQTGTQVDSSAGGAAAAAGADVTISSLSSTAAAPAQEVEGIQQDKPQLLNSGSRRVIEQRRVSPQQQPPGIRYDAEMAAVRSAVERVVLDLVTGTRSSADIKRGLLSHAHQLGVFFGRRDINDLLLPLLITCLNAGEWQLRSSFFGAVAAVGPHTGRDSLDVFLLPCLEQVGAAQGHADACSAAVNAISTASTQR